MCFEENRFANDSQKDVLILNSAQFWQKKKIIFCFMIRKGINSPSVRLNTFIKAYQKLCMKNIRK